MANAEDVARLRSSVRDWNNWRKENPRLQPDISDVQLGNIDLRGADLHNVNFSGTDLRSVKFTDEGIFEATGQSKKQMHSANFRHAYMPGVDLRGVDLCEGDLTGANLTGAKLARCDLRGAQLEEADLTSACLTKANLNLAHLGRANLHRTDLSEAALIGADLSGAAMVESNLIGSKLTGCRIFGVSAWRLETDERTVQTDLLIANDGRSEVTVDNLEMAQFIDLLLHNNKIRDVIDVLTSKVVLILGSFKDERKTVLEEIRAELRQRNLTPVLFDFKNADSKDVTGTIETLSRMARFIIADVTNPSCVPFELATIVPYMRTTPVAPIQLKGSESCDMLRDLKAYEWVLPTYEYESVASLISTLSEKVIEPANAMASQLRNKAWEKR